jgi:hypothetical protein
MKLTTSFLISLFLLLAAITAALPQPLQPKSPPYTPSLTSTPVASLSHRHSHAHGNTHSEIPLSPREPLKKKVLRVIIGIAVVLGLIVLIGGGVYLYYHWFLFKKTNQVPLAAAKAVWGMRKG